MPVIKKHVFVAYKPETPEGTTLFRMCRAVHIFYNATGEVPEFALQDAMRRPLSEHAKQKVHVDEIKRLCHVRTD